MPAKSGDLAHRARLNPLNPGEESRGYDHLWTIDDLTVLFGVTRQAVLKWRTRQKDPLPFINIRGNSRRNVVRFNRQAVLRWAKRNNKRTVALPEGGLLPISMQSRS